MTKKTLELINLTTWPGQLEYFRSCPGGLAGFLEEFQLDGVELIQAGGPPEVAAGLRPYIRGWHLPFWPDWLDFYRQNTKRLRKSFPDRESLIYYYGSDDPKELCLCWRRELAAAERLGARYAVIHVANCTGEEAFSYSFAAGDQEVAEGFIQLLNETLAGLEAEGFQGNIKILLENLWWPGLTLRNPEIVRKLLEEIHYERLGLVLDISHLMNTNLSLRSQREAAAYVHQVLDGLGPLAGRIQAVHLNSALSGAYVAETKALFQQGPALPAPRDMAEFQECLRQVSRHIGRIDPHQPFCDPAIREVLERIRPEFLVHELVHSDPGQARRALAAQLRPLRSRRPDWDGN